MWIAAKVCFRSQCGQPVSRPKSRYCSSRCQVLKWKEDRPQWAKDWSKRKVQNLKQEMLQAYGMSCACCGEAESTFLTLDHINRDGKEDRANAGCSGGYPFFVSLKREGWPNRGYRVLCWNCNEATRYGRPCPHQEKT
jgi:hypothetical protein